MFEACGTAGEETFPESPSASFRSYLRLFRFILCQLCRPPPGGGKPFPVLRGVAVLSVPSLRNLIKTIELKSQRCSLLQWLRGSSPCFPHLFGVGIYIASPRRLLLMFQVSLC